MVVTIYIFIQPYKINWGFEQILPFINKAKKAFHIQLFVEVLLLKLHEVKQRKKLF